MASQSFFDIECSNREVKVIAGRIDIGGSGAPTVKFGLGYSIARTGTGVYQLTLDKAYTGLLHASTMHFDLSGGGAEYLINITAEDVADSTTPQITLSCVVASTGSVTEVPSGDDISFELLLLDGETS